MVLINLNGTIQLLRWHLGGEGESIKIRTYTNTEKTGDHFNVNVRKQMILIELLVHKLLRKITRLLVSFIKILVLLKISSK